MPTENKNKIKIERRFRDAKGFMHSVEMRFFSAQAPFALDNMPLEAQEFHNLMLMLGATAP